MNTATYYTRLISPSNLKAICFDFDGTLVDSVESYIEAFKKAFERVGINVKEEYIAMLLGYSYREIIKRVAGDRFKEVEKEYIKETSKKDFIEKITPKEGAHEILSLFKKKGVLLFIVSGSNKEMLLKIMKKLSLTQFFDEIITTKDDGFKEKPSPEAINYLLKKYNLKKEEIIYIGDGILDFEMAKKAGISFIGIKGSSINEKFSFEARIPLIYSLKELRRLFKKKIIALVGMAGSGKSEVREILAKHNIPFIRFGDITYEIIKKRGFEVNETTEKIVRESLRLEYGMEAYAKLNKEKISSLLENNDVIVIDGLYSWEEYNYLNNTFSECEVILVHIVSHAYARYYRIERRKEKRKYNNPFQRDKEEIFNLNKCPPLALAHYIIPNILDKDYLQEFTEWIILQNILFLNK